MIKVNAMGAITIVFEKDIEGKDIASIFNNDTYFYTNLLIEDIEVNLRMSNGDEIKLKVIDWEVRQPGMFIEDDIDENRKENHREEEIR
ncbi:hypothetical protein [Bacillus sp. FJAT-22090]|uniref:hypothetical protein n=1 Tax=Bacillus sp. FJAT-22090 TaxID=1581038 RepID=UPI0011A3E501|nr:hypothetical protein [Bacillus sp. FJAT-22090]